MPGAPPPLSVVLDAEFLFLLSLLRPIFGALSSEYREQARLWLERLCWIPARVDSARRDRNEYLSRLYYGMMSDSLDAVFLDEPPEGALWPPQDVFPEVDLTSWLHDAEASGTCPDGGQGSGDADERTYLATRLLPEGRGAFGYLAVSLAKEGGPHWVSGPGAAGSPDRPGWRLGDPQATSSPYEAAQPQPPPGPGPGPPAPQGTPRPIDDLVESRPTAEQRQHLINFYDSLIGDVDQAMAQPDKTTPELEKLISSFQARSALPDSTAPADEGVSSHQRELLSQLRDRLEERRDRAAERSMLLDSLEKDGGSLLDSPARAQTRPMRPQRDEDDVWNIRPDNVALLRAAYPQQLIDRFLDAVVRERVAVLGRVRARRYCQRHVEGLEEDASEDMEHYRDATAAWASVLRDSGDDLGSAPDTADQADKCADVAAKAMEAIRELGAARQEFFESEAGMRQGQERLRAEIALLRAEDAQLKRQSEGTSTGSDTAAAGK